MIVPGPGLRSYRLPNLPDPTGYYYCTLQLGCCIVEAICSVHLEVKLASSIDTCNYAYFPSTPFLHFHDHMSDTKIFFLTKLTTIDQCYAKLHEISTDINSRYEFGRGYEHEDGTEVALVMDGPSSSTTSLTMSRAGRGYCRYARRVALSSGAD